ncbi:hypothetical protein PR048_018185 [Dryococelus australis]|uniref:Integrase zinc-binding domain-containing protein n=1 Tax=Dryococelus australis TaxID=614101 RepID=A0ABQ9HBQ9_9NEOP|nr:hypothetical protein PR048_018185 [Dryococelus australis]
MLKSDSTSIPLTTTARRSHILNTTVRSAHYCCSLQRLRHQCRPTPATSRGTCQLRHPAAALYTRAILIEYAVPKPGKFYIFVHAVLFPDLFQYYHNSFLGGHLGQDKTISQIRLIFHLPGMTQDVINWVGSCEECQKAKTRNMNATGRYRTSIYHQRLASKHNKRVDNVTFKNSEKVILEAHFLNVKAERFSAMFAPKYVGSYVNRKFLSPITVINRYPSFPRRGKGLKILAGQRHEESDPISGRGQTNINPSVLKCCNPPNSTALHADVATGLEHSHQQGRTQKHKLEKPHSLIITPQNTNSTHVMEHTPSQWFKRFGEVWHSGIWPGALELFMLCYSSWPVAMLDVDDLDLYPICAILLSLIITKNGLSTPSLAELHHGQDVAPFFHTLLHQSVRLNNLHCPPTT